MSSNKKDSGLFLLFGTIIALIGLAYLFCNKRSKLNFDEDKDGFTTDAQNLQKDWENIGGDFQRAKEKLL